MSYLVEEEEQVGEPHGSTEVIEDVAQAVAYLGEGAFRRDHQDKQEELIKEQEEQEEQEGRGTRGAGGSRRTRGQS